MRLAVLPLLSILTLSACSSGDAGRSDEDPRFAGLDAQILAWRNDIETSHVLCAKKTVGKGCDSFEVACKAERTITPEEQARGVTAKLVAAITFAETSGGGETGSAFAEFAKAGETWTRADTAPVNLSSCASL